MNFSLRISTIFNTFASYFALQISGGALTTTPHRRLGKTDQSPVLCAPASISTGLEDMEHLICKYAKNTQRGNRGLILMTNSEAKHSCGSVLPDK